MARLTKVKKGSNDMSSRARLIQDLKARIIGQDEAIEAVVPRVQMYRANLAPDGRPAGVFMLLGPTGTGKTALVEALADSIHGSPRNVLRVDCAEYQMEHEVAKLIGAPPGYLGHRETKPVFTQIALNSIMSDRANLAIILFDEIEKAAPSLIRLLLGVLDKGQLQLGDATTVQFERTLIFFTSNLGAKEMARETTGGVGFGGTSSATTEHANLHRIAMSAVRRKFTPELINRIDTFITYNTLTEKNVEQILEIQLQNVANHIARRLGDRRFFLQIPRSTRDWLIKTGYSREYGARELKRCIDKHLLEPVADLVADNLLYPGSILRLGVSKTGTSLDVKILDEPELASSASASNPL